MHVNSCNSEMLDSVHHISMKIVDGSIHACPTSHLATLADMASGPPWIFDPFRSSETFFTKAITACGGRSGSWRFALDIFGALRVPWAWIVLFRFVHHRVWLGRGAKLWAASNVLQHRDECLGVPRKTCLRWDWEVGRWTLMRGKKTSTKKKKDIEIHGKHAERCLWRGIGSIGREGWSFWRTERCWFAWWCMVHCLWVDGRSRNWSPGDQTSGFARMLWASTQLWAAFERRDLNWKVHIYRSILWFLSLPIWISNSECVCALPMSDLQIAAT